MKTRIEFACRYWFPRHDRTVRYEHGQRLPVHEDWRWHRHNETLYVDIPTAPGASAVLHLPAPFFTFSAATLQRLQFYCTDQGLVVMFDINATRVWGPHPWRASELWTQIKFDPPGGDGYPHRGPWSLRWRCPDAQDLRARMVTTLETILDDIDEDVHPEAVHSAQSMRREIILATLRGSS